MEQQHRLPPHQRVLALLAVGAARLLAARRPRQLRRVLELIRRRARPATAQQALTARQAVVAVSVRCAGNGCLERSIAAALYCRAYGAWPTWCTGCGPILSPRMPGSRWRTSPSVSCIPRVTTGLCSPSRPAVNDEVFVWLAHRVGRTRRAVSSTTQQTMAELSAYTEETLSVSGVLLCRSFGRRRQEITRFRTLNTHLAGQQLQQQMIGQGVLMCLRTVFAAMPVLAYLVAGFVLAHGVSTAQLTAGTLTAFTALQLQAAGTLRRADPDGVEAQSSLALFERIFGYLDLPPEVTDAPDAITLPPQQIRGAINFRAVSFHYPGSLPARWALANLTLDIEPGQLAAIVGPSGSGKPICHQHRLTPVASPGSEPDASAVPAIHRRSRNSVPDGAPVARTCVRCVTVC